LTPDSRNLTRAFPGVNDVGLTPLVAEPDCTDAYNGVFRQATVFIVGYGTEHETVFTRGDRTAALAMARQQKLTFDQVPARALCDSAMKTLLGS